MVNVTFTRPLQVLYMVTYTLWKGLVKVSVNSPLLNPIGSIFNTFNLFKLRFYTVLIFPSINIISTFLIAVVLNEWRDNPNVKQNEHDV